MPQRPTFEHEQQYWQQGIAVIAGLDEVGLGALAGPVVAGAVILRQPEEKTHLWLRHEVAGQPLLEKAGGQGVDFLHHIRDSKQLSPQQRDKSALLIKEHALAWAIGEATVAEIAALNVRVASHLAMARAVTALGHQPELLLIDGNPAQVHPSIPTVNIIKGDQLSFSIAAASIIAKVHRDQIMNTISEQYPVYGFTKHKGYGSPEHLMCLKECGPCPAHRLSYAPVAQALARRR